MSDSLCVCGHRASNHATPDTGDTRCLPGRRGARGPALRLRRRPRRRLRLLRLPALHQGSARAGPGVAMTLTATRTGETPGAGPTVYLIHFDRPYWFGSLPCTS